MGESRNAIVKAHMSELNVVREKVCETNFVRRTEHHTCRAGLGQEQDLNDLSVRLDHSTRANLDILSA